MNWPSIIENALQYIEEHIETDCLADDVIKSTGISPFYFQKGFSIICGISLNEYIRNRKLTHAGYDLLTTEERVLDLAMRYGYDSADSFTKAFTRFHGKTPTNVRNNGETLKSFVPARIDLTLEGGYSFEYRIEKKESFEVIARAKTITFEDAKGNITKFWEEHFNTGMDKIVAGEYGITYQTESNETVYLIADKCLSSKETPQGCVRVTIPAFEWVILPISGMLIPSLEETNRRIFNDIMPTFSGYEFAGNFFVEKYGKKDNTDEFHKENCCYEIWVPVVKQTRMS